MAYVVGFGAVTAILWEIAEYFAFIRFSEELETAYVDTLGDMTLGLTGSVVTYQIAALSPRRRQASPIRPKSRCAGPSVPRDNTFPSRPYPLTLRSPMRRRDAAPILCQAFECTMGEGMGGVASADPESRSEAVMETRLGRLYEPSIAVLG